MFLFEDFFFEVLFIYLQSSLSVYKNLFKNYFNLLIFIQKSIISSSIFFKIIFHSLYSFFYINNDINIELFYEFYGIYGKFSISCFAI